MPPITFADLRASGVRDVLIYCRDHRCSHHTETNADGWRDHVRLSDIEPNFVCTACGKRGAEVRPKFSQARAWARDDGVVAHVDTTDRLRRDYRKRARP